MIVFIREVNLIRLGYMEEDQIVFIHKVIITEDIQQFNTSTITFPQNQWVKISTCLDFSPPGGITKVWQNDILVSSSNIQGTCGVLEQVHLGLYASPTLSSGTIYNDSVLIKEVTSCQ